MRGKSRGALVGAVLTLGGSGFAQESPYGAGWDWVGEAVSGGIAGGVAGGVGAAAQAALKARKAAEPPKPQDTGTPPKPVDAKDIEKAIADGAAFLRIAQQRDGSWGVGAKVYEAGWDNAYIRVAITALALEALEAAGTKDAEAIKRGDRYIKEFSLAERAKAGQLAGNNDFPYAIAFGLSRALSKPASKERDAAVAEHFKAVGLSIEASSANAKSKDGRSVLTDFLDFTGGLKASGGEEKKRGKFDDGMDYMRSGGFFSLFSGRGHGSFQLALVLSSLAEAKAKGYAVPGEAVDWLVQKLESSRQAHGGYAYHTGGKEDEPGTAARSPAVELALYRAGKSDLKRLEAAAARFMKHREGLEKILKDEKLVTHDSANHSWAKYYYLFGVHGTARILAELGPEKAAPAAQELARALLALQKPNGSWVDSPEACGPSYGAATAILSLRKLQAALGK